MIFHCTYSLKSAYLLPCSWARDASSFRLLWIKDTTSILTQIFFVPTPIFYLIQIFMFCSHDIWSINFNIHVFWTRTGLAHARNCQIAFLSSWTFLHVDSTISENSSPSTPLTTLSIIFSSFFSNLSIYYLYYCTVALICFSLVTTDVEFLGS